jgi:hypothetical protein
MSRGRVLLSCVVFVSLSACGPEEKMKSDGGSKLSATPMRYVEYPAQGALLAQGWDSFRNAPASGVCIEFAESVVPGHDIDVRVDDVYSRDQLNESLRLSVSAGYSGFGTKASGRVNYSNSLSVDRTKSNVLATIEVLKGDQFVVPIGTHAVGKSATFTPMRLNETGKKALSAGLAEFRKTCGDSFVHHIKRGGRLNAYFSFDGLESKDKNALAISISASGWGASVSGDMNKQEEKNRWAKNTGIRIYQSGGPLQPTPVNGEQFNETVRQFLATGDPDLFPTKAFEIGLTRYDNLPQWDSDETLGDPEQLSELIVLYWLFNDLRVQYDNIILGSATAAGEVVRLIDQARWAEGDSIFVQDGATQCKMKATAGGWVPESATGCTNAVAILKRNPWLVSNIFLRAEQLKAITITLKQMIEYCANSSSEASRRAACDRDRVIDDYATSFRARVAKVATVDKKELGSWSAKLGSLQKIIQVAPLVNVQIAGHVRSLLENASADVGTEGAPTAKKDSELSAPPENTLQKQRLQKMIGERIVDLDDAELAKFAVSLKEDVLKSNVPAAVRNQGRENMLDPLLIYLFAGKERTTNPNDLLRDLVRQYYIASMLVPPPMSRSDKEIKVGDVTLQSAAAATVPADSRAVLQALRNQIIPDQLRFANSHCSRKIDSPLCISINEITDIADELELMPVLTLKALAKQDTTFTRKCRWVGSTWAYPGGHEDCENVPVTRNFTEFLTYFGSDKINF